MYLEADYAENMKLAQFSLGLSVKDREAQKPCYKNLGFRIRRRYVKEHLVVQIGNAGRFVSRFVGK